MSCCMHDVRTACPLHAWAAVVTLCFLGGRLPEDVEQLERLNSAMSNLATDNDRDVAGEARAVNDLFKRTPVGSPLPACTCYIPDNVSCMTHSRPLHPPGPGHSDKDNRNTIF